MSRKGAFLFMTPLPKRLFRPFLAYQKGFEIDDKTCRVPTSDGYGLKGLIITLPIFVAVFSASFLLIGLAVLEWWPVMIGVLLGAAAIAFWFFLKKTIGMEQDRFMTFDREKGVVHFECGFWEKKTLVFPFNEAEAYYQRGFRPIAATGAGEKVHQIIFAHLKSAQFCILDASTGGIDPPLALWSFLVQYMDKDGPLPDVPALEDYPNRTQGLGSWEQWKRRSLYDPFASWRAEWSQTPKELKAYAEKHGVEAMLEYRDRLEVEQGKSAVS